MNNFRPSEWYCEVAWVMLRNVEGRPDCNVAWSCHQMRESIKCQESPVGKST